MVIITKHKRDISLLQLGAVLAVSFAGILISRFKNKNKRITGTNLPPLQSQSPDHGDTNSSNKSIDMGDSVTQNTDKEEILLGSPSRRENDIDEKDVYLLPEFEEELKKLVYDECETSSYDLSTPFAFPSEEEDDYENEINWLRNTVRELRERERSLEDKLLEYYSLKEQQKVAMELRSRLKLNQMETKVFNFKIKSLQAENDKLKAQCSEHSKVVLELDLAKSQVDSLKKKLSVKTQQHVEQILSLRERVTKLKEDEVKENLHDSDADKMMQRLREFENEINELTESNTRLHFENLELAEKLESAQIIANSKLEDPEEIKTSRVDVNRLRNENEELKKEIEHLQDDRCTDLQQLVYLKWINACLRHEVSKYRPPPGKTMARDLSATLSPRSEEKVKKLILEYAHNEEENTDCDQWSSSQDESSMITESNFLDDSSVDSLFATKVKKPVKKKKLIHRLMKILYGKKRASYSEASSSTGMQLRPTQSMDFQILLGDKDMEDSIGIVGEELCLESDGNKKKELIKYAEALTKSRPTHKKSVSFVLENEYEH